jgi:hypothetical protein
MEASEAPKPLHRSPGAACAGDDAIPSAARPRIAAVAPAVVGATAIDETVARTPADFDPTINSSDGSA